MKVTIPTYIEGVLDGQYRGYFESKGSFLPGTIERGSKYSVTLYKDLRIQKAIIINEETFNETKNNKDWWLINHTAEAAIEFVQPFFEQFAFLRHKPIEVYVHFPKIGLLHKTDGNSKTFGKLNGRIRARLMEAPAIKENIVPAPNREVVIDPPGTYVPPINGTGVTNNEGCNGCFKANDRANSYFGLEDGPTGTGGCYGLTGGPNGYRGCFGSYGNITGCFVNPLNQQGCFPNLGLGILLPLLFFLLLLFSLFKSCSHLGVLTPVVENIKKDRDDSRRPPPQWVNDTSKITNESELEGIDTSSIAQNKLVIDSISRIAELDSMKHLQKGQVLLKVWDWNVEDRDSVSIIFNNELIAENMRIRKQPVFLKRDKLRYGENYLEIIAINSQKGANTVAVKGLTDRGIICDTALVQKSHQTTRITLKYQ